MSRDAHAALGRASRKELSRAPLKLIAGALPGDLCGHVFIVAPVSNVGTSGLPRASGDTFLNGDGFLYRLDFAPGGASTVSTRIVRTACYYADAATLSDPAFRDYAFSNAGLLRFSSRLGARNFGNTAIVPFRFGDTPARLLVTFDGGRPLEIDSESLDVVTPVGANAEWRPLMAGFEPFPPLFATAHPAIDPQSREIFIVNWGRSVSNILAHSGVLKFLVVVPLALERAIAGASAALGLRRQLRRVARRAGLRLHAAATRLLNWFGGIHRASVLPSDFLYLMRWDGVGKLERWRVVLPSGTAVVIQHTMHQLTVTRDYLVLADTGMKVDADQVFNNPFPKCMLLERFMRWAATDPQGSETTLYIIKRVDLAGGEIPQPGSCEVTVTAQTLTLPLETIHMLADFANDQDQIVLYLQHNCATDVAEWMRSYDHNLYTGKSITPALCGLPNVTGMDISRLRRVVIDAATTRVSEDVLVSDDQCTWGVTFYAGRDQAVAAAPPERVASLYWAASGFFPEFATQFIFDLYADYSHRQVPLDDIRALGRCGRSAAIFRTDPKTMAIIDRYALPRGCVGGALQFIPRAGGSGGADDGYLLWAVVTPEPSCEFWIFDAADLNAPCCKLACDELVFGITLHSTWLQTIGRRLADYAVPARADYAEKVHSDERLRELFERHVFPHCA